ncbi:MAG: GNAT family N-acetyltransferase [Pseudomonadales bacterium]|nr:GNAT family N-acetyltransferase [Pseudomonadales bacterium]
MSNDVIFSLTDPLGEFSIRPLNPDLDASLIHSWVIQPYANYWLMSEMSCQQVKEFYVELSDHLSKQAYLGYHNGNPCFLIEVYDPKNDQVVEQYQPEPGDIGMHILVSPTDKPLSGFTSAVFNSVMAFVFSLPNTKRVVVEPDYRNDKIHKLNKRYGFRHVRQIQMGEKTAYLAFCTRAQYVASKLQPPRQKIDQLVSNPADTVSGLEPGIWEHVNRLHIRKCLSELAHERILDPELVSHGEQYNLYRVCSDMDHIHYEFRATLLPLEHWLIDTDSIVKRSNDESTPLDSLNFIIEFAKTLKINQQQLPTYLEEISATLYSSAYKHAKDTPTSKQLTAANYQVIEAAMIEGHPTFLANNGRVGFDALDFQQFVPEAGSPIKVIWVAAHKSRATFSSSESLSYEQLIQQEFDITTLKSFEQTIRDKGQDPESYLLMPVHPWQWFNKLSQVYAADIANADIICLGYSDDSYQAQQSIRTFFNVSNPENFYVKTAISVLNMGFVRGLSAAYMKVTPAINDWLFNLLAEDAFIQHSGFKILREIAAVGYSNPYYENDVIGDSPYKKMLAGLWRESPIPLLNNNERLMTMAAMLHIDPEGNPLLPELIASSKLTIDAWLSAYLDAYLTPLLHCYFKYSLVYMPHGENLILVMKNSVPTRVFMKDIGEEIAILNQDIELPEEVARISIKVPKDYELLSFFTDIFDCFFRYVTAILFEHMDYQPENFWQLVATCIKNYQDTHPEFADRYSEYDLFTDTFSLSCLNRLQLANNQKMIDLTDPSKLMQFAGTLDNPIASLR